MIYRFTQETWSRSENFQNFCMEMFCKHLDTRLFFDRSITRNKLKIWKFPRGSCYQVSVCTSETYFSALGQWYHLKKNHWAIHFQTLGTYNCPMPPPPPLDTPMHRGVYSLVRTLWVLSEFQESITSTAFSNPFCAISNFKNIDYFLIEVDSSRTI